MDRMDTDHDTSTTDIGPEIVRASRDDLAGVLRVQHAAFLRVARMFDIPLDRLSALTERLEDLHALIDGGFAFLLARVDGRAVGTVRAELRSDGVVEVGRLAVEDGYERRGIATALMRSIEEVWPEARRLELFTGAMATVPLALYAKLGYELFDRPGELREGLVWLAKQR
jgi:GNAT superfamily N-acetyltransferase